MPFGATSAVYAWHRVGNLSARVVLQGAKAPLGRYVDDFFGASRVGVTWTAGRLLAILGLALVFPMDFAKQLVAAILMDVLRIETDLDWATRLVSTCVSMTKRPSGS